MLNVYDPKVTESQIFMDLDYYGISDEIDIEEHVKVHSDAISCCTGVHAIAVMTEWEEFKDIDFAALYETMEKPAFVFDGRNILDHDELRAIGFEVYAIGKPVADAKDMSIFE